MLSHTFLNQLLKLMLLHHAAWDHDLHFQRRPPDQNHTEHCKERHAAFCDCGCVGLRAVGIGGEAATGEASGAAAGESVNCKF